MSAAVSPKIRAERVAIGAAAALAAGKLAVGLATNSIGLLSAAADSLFDVAISSFNLLSIRIADSPADEGHPFGHGKAENLAGLLQTAVIAVVGGGLLVEAVRRLLRGARPEHAEWGIAVMVVATAVQLADHPASPAGGSGNRLGRPPYRRASLPDGRLDQRRRAGRPRAPLGDGLGGCSTL